MRIYTESETENRIAELRAQIAELSARNARKGHQIAELRAQQANINQKTESQKKTESKKQHETTESQDKTENEKQQENTDMNKKPEPDNIQKPDTSQKKKPGESRTSHEPPLPRIRIKICKGGEGRNHHRGAITVPGCRRRCCDRTGK